MLMIFIARTGRAHRKSTPTGVQPPKKVLGTYRCTCIHLAAAMGLYVECRSTKLMLSENSMCKELWTNLPGKKIYLYFVRVAPKL